MRKPGVENVAAHPCRFAVLMLMTASVLIGITTVARAQNAVADWHAVAEQVIAASGRKNAVALPHYAYLDVAIYDAVNAIDRRFQPFAVHLDAPRGASQDAAAAQAAHDVLSKFFASQSSTLDAALVTSLAAIADGRSKTDGIAVGKAVAAQWLQMRADDGLEAPLTYTWGHGPGIWEPVPTYPASPPVLVPPPVGVWLAHFKPFAMTSADQFLDDIPPPPALGSQAWVRDFNRTKDYGAHDSTLRTPAQTEIGLFWTADAAAQYSAALRGLIASQHLSTAASARLGAMSSVAMSDSVTACFSGKYHFARWRPYTAITNGDTDGNAKTVADPAWIPLAVTPGHPEYPAAHGCVTGALMDTLTAFFDSDEVPFSVSSSVTHTTHNFNSFDDVVREVDDARIYGGMHFRSSVREGNRLGSLVVHYMLKHEFHRREE